MLFNSVKEINRLRKEINRLLSKEMSNIYLKVNISEDNSRCQSVDVLALKNLSRGQFWSAPTHEDVIELWLFLL